MPRRFTILHDWPPIIALTRGHKEKLPMLKPAGAASPPRLAVIQVPSQWIAGSHRAELRAVLREGQASCRWAPGLHNPGPSLRLG